MKTRQTKRRAFTLVELLVVIAIIGILFVVLISKVDFATDKAKAAGVQTDFRSYQVAIETVARENAGLSVLVDNDATGEEKYADLEKALNKNLDPKLRVEIDADGKISTEAKDPWKEQYLGAYLAPDADGTVKDRGAIVMFSAGKDTKLGTGAVIQDGNIVFGYLEGKNMEAVDDYAIGVIYTYKNGYGEINIIKNGFKDEVKQPIGAQGTPSDPGGTDPDAPDDPNQGGVDNDEPTYQNIRLYTPYSCTIALDEDFAIEATYVFYDDTVAYYINGTQGADRSTLRPYGTVEYMNDKAVVSIQQYNPQTQNMSYVTIDVTTSENGNILFAPFVDAIEEFSANSSNYNIPLDIAINNSEPICMFGGGSMGRSSETDQNGIEKEIYHVQLSFSETELPERFVLHYNTDPSCVECSSCFSSEEYKLIASKANLQTLPTYTGEQEVVGGSINRPDLYRIVDAHFECSENTTGIPFITSSGLIIYIIDQDESSETLDSDETNVADWVDMVGVYLLESPIETMYDFDIDVVEYDLEIFDFISSSDAAVFRSWFDTRSTGVYAKTTVGITAEGELILPALGYVFPEMNAHHNIFPGMVLGHIGNWLAGEDEVLYESTYDADGNKIKVAVGITTKRAILSNDKSTLTLTATYNYFDGTTETAPITAIKQEYSHGSNSITHKRYKFMVATQTTCLGSMGPVFAGSLSDCSYSESFIEDNGNGTFTIKVVLREFGIDSDLIFYDESWRFWDTSTSEPVIYSDANGLMCCFNFVSDINTFNQACADGSIIEWAAVMIVPIYN